MANTTNNLGQYLEKVAKVCSDKYGDDYYEALNVAECIVSNLEKEPEGWACSVHAILEGEL